MTLGQRIRFYRTTNFPKPKSQKDIENETGIPQTTLSGWENNISEPRASELQLLAAALNVTVAELLDDSDPTAAEQAATLERKEAS